MMFGRRVFFSSLYTLVVLTVASSQCILEYVDLEQSLFASKTNIDSLTRAWFPPNEENVPVVEVFYYINDSDLIHHPLILELGGVNDTQLRQTADYRYRWSINPMYLFMNPQVLEALSLYTIRIRDHTARLVVSSVCENYTVDGIGLPEYHLNQMTTLLRSYAIMRRESLNSGIVEASQGYASFYNATRSDFIVLAFDEDYQGSMFLLIFSLIALAIFVTLVTPLLIFGHYKKLFNLAQDEDSAFVFVVWGTVTTCVIMVIIILVVDLVFVVREVSDNPPSLWQYILAFTLVVVLVAFDFFLALIVPKKTDFPIPSLLRILCCRKQSSFLILLAQVLAIWFVTMCMQLVTFHTTFIFLAFIASPVEVASTALLYVAAAFCGNSLLTLFYAVFQKNSRESHMKTLQFYFQRLIYLILFVCVLAFVVLFSTCFLRVTIYVGDFESGGIPSLFASLAPSILLGGLGFIAKSVLQKYDLKKGTAPHPSVLPSSEQPEFELQSEHTTSSSSDVSPPDILDNN